MLLEVGRGEFVYVIGDAGSGASTLVRLATGRERPTSGRVWVAGREVSALPPDELYAVRRQVGVVHATPRLVERLDVAGNVGFALLATATLLGAGPAVAPLVTAGNRRVAAGLVALAAAAAIAVDALPGADFGGPPPLLLGAVVLVLGLVASLAFERPRHAGYAGAPAAASAAASGDAGSSAAASAR